MSVHKDKTTGKWYYTGKYKDLSGKRHDYKKRGFRTKGEAKEAEEAFLQKIKGGYGRIRMRDLIDVYQKESTTRIKASSLMLYRNIENIAIMPFFGSMFIDEIRSSDVRKWIDTIAKEGIDGKKYAYQTYNNMLLHLSGLLTFAVDRNLLASNPCHRIRAPKDPNMLIKKQDSEINFWELDEYKKFISTVDDENMIDVFDTLFYTGLRIGEFCALQWSDFDSKSKKLSITKSLSGNISRITTPKTIQSLRTIDLPERLNKRLKDRYERNKRQDGFNDQYYIFGDINYHTAQWFRRRFDRYISKANVKRITLHGLRHSHASLLLSNPLMSELLVAERMGHSVDMLRSTYAHIYEKNRSIMIDYIEKL